MRSILFIVLVMLIGVPASWWLSWLCLPVSAGLLAYFLRPRPAFLCGLIAGMLSWGLLAAGIEVYTEGVMGAKIASLLMNSDNPVYAVGITALAGGLACAFAALSGKLSASFRDHKKLLKRRYSSMYSNSRY